MDLMDSIALQVLAAVAVLLLIKSLSYLQKHDPAEPRLIRPMVPLVGHIPSLLCYGSDYFHQLHKKHKESIFSLPVLSRKLYIVQCPQMISQIQRNTRSLTFTPFALGLLNRLMDPGQETMDKVSHGWDSDSLEERQNTIHANLERVHRETLTPGPQLNKLLSIQLCSASAEINAVPDGTAMDVWQWLRRVFLVSSMDALLGPENLFRQRPELEASAWEFLEATDSLLPKFLPSILAAKGFKARNVLRDALLQWVRDGHHEQASHFMRESVATIQQSGVSAEKCGEILVMGVLAALSNVVPTTFWSLMYLYQHPDTLEQVRKDLEQPGVIRMEGNDRMVDVLQLHKTCPLLKSILREVLRTESASLGGRYVLEDTMIGEKYLLKKGGVIITNGTSIHMDANIWGSDVGEFNPNRFLDSQLGTFTSEPGEPVKRVHPAAWRGFGGGTSMCPGRHLAQLEIVGSIAIFALKFDMFPEKVDDLVLPSRLLDRFPVAVTMPKNGVRVVLKERPGTANLTFKCQPLSRLD